ncbi:MAG: GAF domain-containing protein [Candidatus Heimdallarchaeota archaeon]|nr:GAF domain-containing protein [Candidatus Heimdallarchaeota archaeon]
MSSESTKSRKVEKEIQRLKKINQTQSTLDDKIAEWIKNIGKFSGSDRVYVYFFAEDENGFIIANNTHEFCKRGIHSVKADQQNVPIDLFPFYKSVVYDKLEFAWINSIHELTEEAKSMKELMEFQGVKSILAIPISGEKIPIGFIGFETVKKEKRWKEDHLELLKSVSELILLNK